MLIDADWSRIYCGPAPDPADLWLRWNFDPVLLVALSLFAIAVARDARGAAAIGVLCLAFVSPLCALSSALFSARVVHHVLLVAVVAPLLALIWPSRRARSAAVAFTVSTSVLWFWHLPAAYDLALGHVGVYWVMQLSLIAGGIWFWRAVFAEDRSPVEAMTVLVGGFAQMGMLGAILTLAPEPLYAAHAVAPLGWGLTPLADQQLGGLLMWVPAGLPYAAAATVVARRAWSAVRSGT